MFLKIDEWLIMWANWFVRQVELYSQITRRDIHAVALFCMQMATIAACLFTFLYTAISPERFPVVAQWIMCCGWWMIFFYHRRQQRIMPDELHTLPKEIITRKIDRVTYMIVTVLNVIISTLYIVAPLSESSMHNIMLTNAVIASTFCWCVVTCLEYLICTISLPPKERARQAYERERKSYVA